MGGPERRPAETQADYVVRHLTECPCTLECIASYGHAPESSFRRAIQWLRSRGHKISVSGGVYTLHRSAGMSVAT